MKSRTVTIALDSKLVVKVDCFVASGVFESRSHAVRVAVDEMLLRMRRSRLAAECAKLDPDEEQALAEVGMIEDAIYWPSY